MMERGDAYFRSSRQLRPVLPEADGAHHPRCLEMAEAMRDLFAAHGGVRFRDLIGAGFTWAELTEYHDEAGRLAGEASVRQISPRADALEDVVLKAREAIPNRPALPRGIEETQDTLVRWGRYCMARSALLLDPWPSQRERCLALLRAYLDRSAMFSPSKDVVVAKVAETLPEVMQ